MRSVICSAAVAFSIACASEPARPAASTAAPSADTSSGRATVVGQAPAGTVVTLESVAGPASPLPPGPAILDQYSRNFVPDVLIVRVGQPVEFRNSEDIDHNVTVVRSQTGTGVFDTSTAPFQRYEHTFDRAGRYEVSCDVHPGMRATIVATTAPHALVVDRSGRFTFGDLDPGSYKLGWSTGSGALERTIDVSPGSVDLGALSR
jgi:plastocyanin